MHIFLRLLKRKGSVNVEHAHFTAYVQDILLSLMRFGVRRFFIIDGDESETSTMLHIHPELEHTAKTVEEYRSIFLGAVVNGLPKITFSSRTA